MFKMFHGNIDVLTRMYNCAINTVNKYIYNLKYKYKHLYPYLFHGSHRVYILSN